MKTSTGKIYILNYMSDCQTRKHVFYSADKPKSTMTTNENTSHN